MRCFVASLTGFYVLMSPVFCQPGVGDGPLQAFESVSVLPSHPANGPIISVSSETGGFSARGVSLKRLIGFAYDIDSSRIVGGPAWIDSTYYQIEAARPAGTGSIDAQNATEQTRGMVQGLLYDHFGLIAHKEQAPLFILETTADGPSLPSSDESAEAAEGVRPTEPRRLVGKGVRLADLSIALQRQLARPVLDRTGLTANYDVDLSWDGADGDVVGLTLALNELGLALRSVPIEQVVIDQAHELPPDLGRGRVFEPLQGADH